MLLPYALLMVGLKLPLLGPRPWLFDGYFRAAIDWKGHYQIEGRAFVYTDRESGRVTTILGYPTAKNAQLG